MGLPYRSISAICALGTYLSASGRISTWPQAGPLRSFFLLWAVQLGVWVIWRVLFYPKFFSPLRGLPGPSDNSWYNGQFKKIVESPSGAPMIEWMDSIPNAGLIRYLGPLNQERLLPTSPKALVEVLNTKNYEFQKPSSLRHTIGRILGIGLLLAEGEEHKVQRKKLAPAFSVAHLKGLYPVFWNMAREGVEAMTAHIKSETTGPKDKPMAVIEVGNWASRTTLDIIGVTGLGRGFGAIKNPENKLNQTYQSLFKPNRQAQILNILGLFLPPRLLNLLPVKRNEDIHGAARLIRGTCADLIQEKRERQARNEPLDLDILSAALDSKLFNDEDLIDQLMTFLAAGHETTASAMTWAAYLLAKHPDVQTRLRAEIRERLPSISGASSVSSADIDHMPYLNAVCNEILRYFPPAPLTLRHAVRDTTIQGQFVPKGTQVMIVPWAINRSATLWGPDALEFRPERWLPKFEGDKAAALGGAVHNYAFMSFLHGPRSCIGQGFAKAEFAILLASWVGRFQMELHNKEEMDEKKVEIKGGITVRPAKGMHIEMTVLEGW
ncbi:cytochrome P450 4V2 [Podospora australis]|uniref:Cytochrome P450 4V2 n=1 Tax=Podospora australis TaxID=1536484 RepID=A0AAN7AID3_9PEZI|nr:cytochrome P450 4V2 [Podospora australis]